MSRSNMSINLVSFVTRRTRMAIKKANYFLRLQSDNTRNYDKKTRIVGQYLDLSTSWSSDTGEF